MSPQGKLLTHDQMLPLVEFTKVVSSRGTCLPVRNFRHVTHVHMGYCEWRVRIRLQRYAIPSELGLLIPF